MIGDAHIRNFFTKCQRSIWKKLVCMLYAHDVSWCFHVQCGDFGGKRLWTSRGPSESQRNSGLRTAIAISVWNILFAIPWLRQDEMDEVNSHLKAWSTVTVSHRSHRSRWRVEGFRSYVVASNMSSCPHGSNSFKMHSYCERKRRTSWNILTRAKQLCPWGCS